MGKCLTDNQKESGKKVEVIEEITTAAKATDAKLQLDTEGYCRVRVGRFPMLYKTASNAKDRSVDIDPEDEESDHCDQLCEDQLLKTVSNDLSVHYTRAVSSEANV